MPNLKTYNLFISHSWTYGDAYEKLVKFFDEHPNFKWANYSVPKNDPIHNAANDAELYAAIKRQMGPVHCVVMLSGVYSTHSKWINKEIQIAKRDYSKPIVAVDAWGAERTSKVVTDNADFTASWRSSSIVKAIREYSL